MSKDKQAGIVIFGRSLSGWLRKDWNLNPNLKGQIWVLKLPHGCEQMNNYKKEKKECPRYNIILTMNDCEEGLPHYLTWVICDRAMTESCNSSQGVGVWPCQIRFPKSHTWKSAQRLSCLRSYPRDYDKRIWEKRIRIKIIFLNLMDYMQKCRR